MKAKTRLEKLIKYISEENDILYRIIVENANIGILIIQDGVICYANPFSKTILNTGDTIVSQPFINYIFPDDRDMVLKLHERRMKGETTPSVYPLRIIQKDGSTIWIEHHTVVIENKGKKAALVFFNDITQRKQTEDELDNYRDNLQMLVEKQMEELKKSNQLLKDEISVRMTTEQALRESEKKYRTILENIEEGYFEVDLNGNMTFFNSAMCRIAGVHPETLLGLNYKLYTTPETALKMSDAFNTVFITGAPIHEMDFEIIRNDGNTRILELSISSTFDNEGNINGFKGIARDVTERRQAETLIRQSEKKYRLIAENTSDVIVTLRPDKTFTYISPSIELLTGFCSEEAMRLSLDNFLEPDSYQRFWDILQNDFFNEYEKRHDLKRFRQIELQLKRRNKEAVWTEATISLLRDDSGNACEILCVFRDITERKQSEAEMAYLAYHDFLTNLYNRKAFIEKLEESIKHAKRYGIKRAIFYLDLDCFKQVNDTYGHEIGDKLLKQVADRLIKTLRETDSIFRIGGDEFTVILNNVSDLLPEAVGKKLVNALSEPYQIDSLMIDYISTSIGISVFPDDGNDLETLIKNADTAMYKAKEKGCRYVCYKTINHHNGEVKP